MVDEVVKRYMTKSKMVTVVSSQYGYTFCIVDKCNQKKYISTPYQEYEECEKDSYKVSKSIKG